jgi:mannose-1-phosphate guanylyltransferase
MSERGEIWGLVLAAGEGSRLRGVTRSETGRETPKQYCALVEERTLLRATLDRMERVVPRRRIVVVVAEAHRAFWERELEKWPAENVVVQPENRGTAAGILLPLLTIAGRDPEARVVVTPSDHHVEDERPLREAIAEALSALERPLDRIVLLGIEPDDAEVAGSAGGADSGYGWIVPRRNAIGAPRPVERFVEKPAAAEAARLAAAGAAWNSFVFVASLESLLALYVRRAPALLDELVEAVLARRPSADRAAELRALYARLEPRDFSADLLAGSEDALLTLSVAPCGWTDLGTPERLAACRNARAAARGARQSRVLAAGRSVAAGGAGRRYASGAWFAGPALV